jgi:hypothetical protein
VASIAADTDPFFLMLAGTIAATAAFFGGVGIVTAGRAARLGTAKAALPVPANNAVLTSATAIGAIRNPQSL